MILYDIIIIGDFMKNNNIKIGDIVIVKDIIFQFHNGKINPQKDHAEHGRPCIVVAKKEGYIYILAVKGKYGYEKKDLKFMDANNDSFSKDSLYQIEEIIQIKDGYYPLIGSLDNHELYELLYALVWYQYASEEYGETVRAYQNRLYDEKFKVINDDINDLIMTLYHNGANKEQPHK